MATIEQVKSYLRGIPKFELHVHLEGSIKPETLLKLALRNGVTLPAFTVEELQKWYTFTDLSHFVIIYLKVCECIKTTDDIELITKEFLQTQASQNVVYSEVTYTAWTHFEHKSISFADQLAAINRAREWGERELGVKMQLIVDIPRMIDPKFGMWTVESVAYGLGNGVAALGLGGREEGNPPEKFADAFAKARELKIPMVLHAGEVVGPTSIRNALREGSVRIGHGVRCLDDPDLVAHLKDNQIPLEICLTSNVCLGIAPSLANHPLKQLLDAGLFVTINSDDPPMFNTTLNDEYIALHEVFGLSLDEIDQLALNAVRASLLPELEKQQREAEFLKQLARLKVLHKLN